MFMKLHLKLACLKTETNQLQWENHGKSRGASRCPIVESRLWQFFTETNEALVLCYLFILGQPGGIQWISMDFWNIQLY